MKKILTLIALFTMIASYAGAADNNIRARKTYGAQQTNVQTGVYVDQILVEKSKRTLKLIARGKVVKEYRVSLGQNPVGQKTFQGDGRTPEGVYQISAKKPNSQFHRGLKISYPNANDIARARSAGRNPGGSIFIHGGPRNNPNFKGADWTRGCIGVTDNEIDEIYKYVGTGTQIIIRP